MANDHRHNHPSLRNREPILAALQKIIPADTEGDVLEIGSGSACHIEHFAPAFPKLRWQPSEYLSDGDESGLADIDAVLSRLPNTVPAIALDASLAWSAWPSAVQAKAGGFAVVYLSNVTHIAPWSVTCGIVAGAGRALCHGGVLIMYGPFMVDRQCTTQSNADFDESLRARNPALGYRDVADIEAEAAKHGLQLQERLAMPANNFLLHFLKLARDNGIK